MIQDYPKMVYKTRSDYKIAQNLEDEERLANDGYGSADIVLFGKKPEGIVTINSEDNTKFDVAKGIEPTQKVEKIEPKSKRKRRSPAEMAEFRKQEEAKKKAK